MVRILGFYSTIILLIFSTKVLAFESEKLWIELEIEQPLIKAAVGTITINSGSASKASGSTRLNFYSSSGCVSFLGAGIPNGTFTFSNPSTVKLDADRVYSIGNAAIGGSITSTSSIFVWPKTDSNAGGTNVFTPNGVCLDVDCSTGSQCIGSDSETVGLT